MVARPDCGCGTGRCRQPPQPARPVSDRQGDRHAGRARRSARGMPMVGCGEAVTSASRGCGARTRTRSPKEWLAVWVVIPRP